MSVKVPKANLWRAIRAMCLECSNGSKREVRFCTSESCPLYPYRFGRMYEILQTPLQNRDDLSDRGVEVDQAGKSKKHAHMEEEL